MFEPTSRYEAVDTVKMTLDDGRGEPRVVSYKRRRLIPPGKTLTTLAEHTVVEGDRLDNLAARYVGDPEQFWRICDANEALNPADLTAEVGRTLRVPVPQV